MVMLFICSYTITKAGAFLQYTAVAEYALKLVKHLTIITLKTLFFIFVLVGGGGGGAMVALVVHAS